MSLGAGLPGAARVMVIRLGALGDFIQSFSPFAAIRAHHPRAAITLLTTAPLAELARLSPWFDRVVLDARPAWWDVLGLARLRSRLRGHEMVYDLQTSARSSRYFRLAGRPAWSGVAAGCAFPHDNPARDGMHTRERQAEQLRSAGIVEVPRADTAWLRSARRPALPTRYGVLVPGASPHRPEKRWPARCFAELARWMARRGVAPVVVGDAAEARAASVIRRGCAAAIDLTGQTSLIGLASVISGARYVVGNDTGPMHFATALGRPATVLFSAASDPALTAPRYPDGSWARVVRADDLATLDVEQVAAMLA